MTILTLKKALGQEKEPKNNANAEKPEDKYTLQDYPISDVDLGEAEEYSTDNDKEGLSDTSEELNVDILGTIKL